MLGMKLDRSIRSLVYNQRGMAFFALAEYPQVIRDFSKAVLYDPRAAETIRIGGLRTG